jgi:Cof subfamily protein (haloacid dehalogenase superfamily)
MSSSKLKCRLFATDMDGTILVDEGPKGCHLPERTRRALNALHASGVTVVLASGRMHESIRAVSASLDFHGPAISYNGAMIKDAQDRLLYHAPLDLSVSDELVDWAESHGVPLNFYHGGKLMSRRFQPWWDLYEGRHASDMVAVESLRPYMGKEATKLLIMSEPQTIRRYEPEFRERFRGRANVLISMDEYLEFMNPEVDKGRALERLAAELGIQRSEIVAAGDGYNDMEMLRFAGHSVAVATGRQELKDAADAVVASPAEGGVAEFIEKQLLGS